MYSSFRLSVLLPLILYSHIYRVYGKCENDCNMHGYCTVNDKCLCFRGIDGYPQFTGFSCADMTCPRGVAWVGHITGANDAHPIVECSNRGTCDRQSGICTCQPNFGGIACERTECLNDCSGNGECMTQQQLAQQSSRVYVTPWDAQKQTGCLCDVGYRGSDCSEVECPSGPDVLRGPGNESGRDCSGRGICNYKLGLCECFKGYFGQACEFQTSLVIE